MLQNKCLTTARQESSPIIPYIYQTRKYPREPGMGLAASKLKVGAGLAASKLKVGAGLAGSKLKVGALLLDFSISGQLTSFDNLLP